MSNLRVKGHTAGPRYGIIWCELASRPCDDLCNSTPVMGH